MHYFLISIFHFVSKKLTFYFFSHKHLDHFMFIFGSNFQASEPEIIINVKNSCRKYSNPAITNPGYSEPWAVVNYFCGPE